MTYSAKTVILSLFFLSASCSRQEKFGDQVMRLADGCRGSSTCVIDLSGIKPAGWDKLFYFKYIASAAEISMLTGRPVNSITEFSTKIVLSRNDEILYYEEQAVDVEKPKSNEIIFHMPDSQDHLEVAKFSAKFYFSKVIRNDGTAYFVLKPVSGA